MLQEDRDNEPKTIAEVIIDKFFIVEGDCFKVIRVDKQEVVLFRLYLSIVE